MEAKQAQQAQQAQTLGALLCILVLVVMAYWAWRPVPPAPTPPVRQCEGAGTCDYNSDCGDGGKCQKIHGVCTCMRWANNVKVVTNNCYKLDKRDPKLPDACNKEYGFFGSQVGPNGEKGNAEYPGGECPGGPPYPACAACPMRDYGPVPCIISGWVPANALPDCSMAAKTRPDSSYECAARP